MQLRKRHDTTDFCPRQLVPDLLRGNWSINQSCSYWRAMFQFKETNCRRGHRLWLTRSRM